MDVTVIDRAAGPGQETSFRNGALLHTSLVDPWNAPGVLGQLLRSIGREDSALLLRMHAVPSLLGWGARFIRESSARRYRANTLTNAALAAYSRTMMQQLRSEASLQYEHWRPGTLLIFREPHSFLAAQRTMRELQARGVRAVVYNTAQLQELDPALDEVADELAGGIHYPDDEGGDAFAFCTQLAQVAHSLGVEFRFGTAVDRLHFDGMRIRGVDCGSQTVDADAVVVAAGSYSAPLVAPLGIRLAIRPVKGYSITLHRDAFRAAPRVPVIDHALHAAVVPVGQDRIRMAGTAEFAGYDLSIPRTRIENLLVLLERIFPGFSRKRQVADIEPWTGLRAVSPDGVPLLGGTAVRNLFVNTGHGHLGWTLAAGSGKLVADIVAGVTPALAMNAYGPQRF
jgi:D-amino-acid dehydrogenase